MELSTGAGEVARTCGIIGRDAELSRFAAVLEARQPRIVLVQGEASIGKTALLEAMQAYAKGGGWKIVPAERLEKLSVAASTTEDAFCHRTRELLGAATEDGSVVAGGSEAHPRLDPPTRQIHSLVAELQRRAPVLLLVDGYQATRPFTAWLRRVIIPEIKASGAAVVLVLAEREGHFQDLESLADETILLGPLDEAALRSLLTATNERLVPPMEEYEFQTYLEALTAQPDILASLTDVLSLAARKATPE